MVGPIFLREWMTLPRRPQHYGARAAYLGLLWVLGLTAWQVTIGWSKTASLGETARFGWTLFQIFSFVQLGLLLFFAALAGASAIALEKDRRTFVLLLLTDLRNHEIVLGKLLGSLLQIGVLLAATLPISALCLLLGGIAPAQAAQGLLILAATVLAAGSLGAMVALWRDQTFQSLALTVLFLVLYLCLVRVITFLPGLLADAVGWNLPASWEFVEIWLDPFVCLESVLMPPTGYNWPIAPAFGYAGCMVSLSILLNGWSMLRLRVWNPSGEPIMQRERPQDADEKDLATVHAAPGRARPVWGNPILWREVRTRAYGRRPALVKLAYFVVIGLLAHYAVRAALTGGRDPFAAASGLLPATILSLLLISAQAVTAITSERDRGALDLLLVTDLSPREFIFGKLAGILYNAKEYLLPPLLFALLYAWLGMLAAAPRNHPELATVRNGQSAFCVIGTVLLLVGFVVVLGLHIGLRTENGRLAIMHSLGTVFFLSVGTLVCIYLIIINGRFEYQWGSFLLFIIAGVGGLWWVLNGDRPATALTLASWICPFAVFYGVMNVLIGKPGSEESSDPFLPFGVIAIAFGFTIVAMMVPLLSEFDVALGRTGAGNE